MPTVHSEGGFHVRIYTPPREHGPAHVHVVRAGAEIIIRLGEGDSPPAVVEVHGMSDRDALRAYRLVELLQPRLWEKWREYHDEAIDR